MSLLPTTQACSLPDGHGKIIWRFLNFDSKLSAETPTSQCECGTSDTQEAAFVHSALCFTEMSQESEQSIQIFHSFALREAWHFVEDARRISGVFLSVWRKNRMKIDTQGVAGRVFSPAEETDKSTHRYNKRYPGDMSQLLCHYLRLCRETTMFWGYRMELHVLASTDFDSGNWYV